MRIKILILLEISNRHGKISQFHLHEVPYFVGKGTYF